MQCNLKHTTFATTVAAAAAATAATFTFVLFRRNLRVCAWFLYLVWSNGNFSGSIENPDEKVK